MSVEELKGHLSALPTEDRAALAMFLLESLDEDESEDPTEVQAAWDAELARRLEEIRSGKVVGIPAEVVMEDMRRKYP
jgi:putative addiction module component (TIGR02574 family)